MLKISAVVVTHNRLQLLEQVLQALKTQNFLLNEIIVVNNCSTDGTNEWLENQTGIVNIHQPNTGGSGGFYTGIELATRRGCDYIWVMDDDTICEAETLTTLVLKLAMVQSSIGFIGSKCVWVDGKPHYMNIPDIKPSFNKTIPFNSYDEYHILLTESSSFVSLLINAEAVRKVGLPYKEFFIWGDDQEYTRRITKAGYLGLYCMDSIVLHKTPVNYFPDFYTDNVKNLWKHKYGFRNEFFMMKKNKGVFYFFFWLPLKVGYTSLKIIHLRKANRILFIKTLLNSAWKSIFFNPEIDRINKLSL